MPVVADPAYAVKTPALAMSQDPLQPLDSAVDDALERLRTLRDRVRTLQETNDELRRENDRLRSRLDSGAGDRERLESLESEREAIRERVTRALRALEGEADGDG